VTPDAYIDDGVLDVCVITAGDPLTTIQQILAILLHREPGSGRSEYFQAAHFWISAPASVDLQLDGSRVRLRDCLATPPRKVPRPADDPDAVVTYRFDAMPRALRVAIPGTYGGTLFEGDAAREKPAGTEQQPVVQDAVLTTARESAEVQHESPQRIKAMLESGRKVTVVGVGPIAGRDGSYVIAGTTSDDETGESRPVAVRINDDTTLVSSEGKPLAQAFAATLADGAVIVVEGKQTKRGVIRAERVVALT
jgi:hypothetical protein